jgi:hypothetical protein
MNWRHTLALVLLMGCPTLAGFARVGWQDIDTLAKAKTPVQRVTAMLPAVVGIPPGGKVTTDLVFQVKPGFHINSNKPGSDLLLPTVVTLSPPTNIAIGGLEYPPGREQSIPFSPDEKLSVYTGDFAVTASLSAAKNMPLGRFRVHGFLTYQACDDRACYPPTKLPISFDVQVAPAIIKTHRNPPQSPHPNN